MGINARTAWPMKISYNDLPALVRYKINKKIPKFSEMGAQKRIIDKIYEKQLPIIIYKGRTVGATTIQGIYQGAYSVSIGFVFAAIMRKKEKYKSKEMALDEWFTVFDVLGINDAETKEELFPFIFGQEDEK